MPVKPPIVNKKRNPNTHICVLLIRNFVPLKVTIHLNTLIPVGTAIIIVAAVKYSRESISIPTLNIWCAQTTHPKIPILIIAKNIPATPKVVAFPLQRIIECLTKPNPGKIKMYTSGWPKNQNKCWNNKGSPPPNGSKKEVFKLRSNKSIVIPPAKTGKLNTNKNAVTHTLTKNKGILNQFKILIFKLFIEQRKLIDPAIELIPARCNLKIILSTVILECPEKPLKGG